MVWTRGPRCAFRLQFAWCSYISPIMRAAKQLPLPLRQHGGRRPGAGRKPKGPRPLVSHKARALFDKPLPVHVTLRVGEDVWNLRSGRSYRRLKSSLAAAAGRFGLRVIAFSIQGNHLHFIVEANDTEALSRGMQGLCIRMVKALNAMMRRSGRVFADHYHSRLLRSPSETVSAIAYAAHVCYERFRLRNSAGSAALHIALAVALGAFGLAVGAIIHSLRLGSTNEHRRLLIVALGLWPVITALPAFLLALVASWALTPAPSGPEAK